MRLYTIIQLYNNTCVQLDCAQLNCVVPRVCGKCQAVKYFYLTHVVRTMHADRARIRPAVSIDAGPRTGCCR